MGNEKRPLVPQLSTLDTEKTPQQVHSGAAIPHANEEGAAWVESLWVRIKVKANKTDIIMGVYYRPLNQDKVPLIASYEGLLSPSEFVTICLSVLTRGEMTHVITRTPLCLDLRPCVLQI